MKLSFLSLIFLLTNFLANGQSITDTLTVNPNSIIFYSITQTEFDTLSVNDSDGGLNEVISDFEHYVGKLVPTLKQDTTMYVLYTSHRFYQINNGSGTTYFDRVERRNVVGMILNDTTRHEINRGVGTAVDMIQTINEFFKKE